MRYERCGTQQRRADRLAELFDAGVDLETKVLEDNLARQRIPVAVKTSRGQSNHDVADRDAAAINQRLSVDGTDDKAGEIVLAVGIKAGHLRSLTTDEGATVLTTRAREAVDDVLDDVGLQASGCEVIQKKQRPGALDKDVVDAVIDEIDADRAVLVGKERNFELGADSVGARHENRILPCARVEAKEPAKRADLREYSGGKRRLRQAFDAANGLVGRIDVDARPLVVH